jgi:hypothetical protein
MKFLNLKIKKGLLLSILLTSLISPISASAQPVLNLTITGLVGNVASVIWTVATIIIIMFWVITGLLFLMAAGDPGKIGTAKKALFAAVGGTVIVILAYSVTNIISNALLSGR